VALVMLVTLGLLLLLLLLMLMVLATLVMVPLQCYLCCSYSVRHHCLHRFRCKHRQYHLHWHH
jgi:hypothetical protein